MERTMAARADWRSICRSPRPSAWPARTVAAWLRPRWSMKAREASWSETPCAASGTAPTQPTIMALPAKRPTSAKSCPPMGSPSQKTCAIASQSGRQRRWRSRYCGRAQRA